MSDPISKFEGKYFFLSNFYPCPVTYCGLPFRSSEAAYQSAKCAIASQISDFCDLTPDESKHLGRKVKIRRDWEDVKFVIMYEVCKAKFTQNSDLREKLLSTGDSLLTEGNTWNDKVWGVCNGVGENHLGQILMRLRKEFREGG